MHSKRLLRSGLAAAGLIVACAQASWGQVRVSGIEHAKMGSAVLGPVDGRRLPVHNIGSSGQDGVEIRLDSASGGAVSVDLDEMLIPSPAAREIRIRPKGWDGTIKGTVRLSSRPPDGTPGASLDVACDFSSVSATTIRVVARDSFGNMIHTSVVPASSITCIASVASPPGTGLACRLAIKTKGVPVHRTQQLSVELPEGPWTITGLSPAALHEVAVLGIEPETCGACDTWLGTESMLVTASGLHDLVVSDASLRTFGVSSHGLGVAAIDEVCDDFADCDQVRALKISHLDTTLEDGVAIDLDDDGIGGTVTMRWQNAGIGHTINVKAVNRFGSEISRWVYGDDPFTGSDSFTCDASASGASAIDVHFFDANGSMLFSRREQTGVLAIACTGGPEVGSDLRCACLHGRWRVDMSAPDTLVLPDGTPVSGVSSVAFVPVVAAGTSPEIHALHVLANNAIETVIVRPVNDPPSMVRLSGLTCVATGNAVVVQGVNDPDTNEETVTLRVPCCDMDSDDDGLDVSLRSTYGGMVRLDTGPLLAPTLSSREIRIRPRGWDGTIKGTVRLSGGGGGGADGSLHIDCDFAQMNAAAMQWAAYGADGSVLASGSTPGSSLGGVITPPPGTPIPTCAMAINRKGPPGQHRMGGTIMFGGGTVTLSGLGSASVQGVSAFGFTPIECAACSRFADVDSMHVTYGGMDSLHVLGASLLTFGAEVAAVGDAQVMEWVNEGIFDDTTKARKLASHGADGVSYRWGNPLLNELSFPAGVQGAGMSLARGNCCRGHVIIMKLYDDEEHEAARVSSTSNAGGTSHTMVFDGSASGVQGFTLVLRNAGGATISSINIDGPVLDLSYVGPCDAAQPRAVSFDAASIRMELCDAPVTVFVLGAAVPGVSSVSMDCRSGMQWVPSSLTGMDVTGNPTDYIQVSGFALIENAPPCPADFDGNGVREVPDIFAFLSAWFIQDPRAYHFGGVVGVPAIFAFLSVWFAGCP